MKASTPSFVTELPLVVDSLTERELLARFQAARQLYNACLGETKKRLQRARASLEWQEAKSLPKSAKNKSKRNRLYKDAKAKELYSDYDIQSYATQTAKASHWIAEKIDAQCQQKLATRAFNAVERTVFGGAKKLRFKVPSRFRSVEGKTNKQGLRWKNGQVVWGKLKVPAIIYIYNEVICHGLSSRVKFVRLLWRILNGKRRWFVQLVCEGVPFVKEKNKVSEGSIGIDLNISNVAYVSDEDAGLLPFAENVSTYQKEIARLQRQMQRSQRANNPDKFEPDFESKKGRKTVVKKGKVKKGAKKKPWNQSKTYNKIRAKKAEIERKRTAYAKSQNRKLVNEVLRHGREIKTENVSVKGWQKRYGKAIRDKSPSFFMSELKRKAESAGGLVIRFSTRTTALSQTHLTGTRKKKSLSERVHKDESGFEMQRDLFSAFLSRHVYDDTLSLRDAQSEYPGLESVLMVAWEAHKSCEKSRRARNSGEVIVPLEQLAITSETNRQIAPFREAKSGRLLQESQSL